MLVILQDGLAIADPVLDYAHLVRALYPYLSSCDADDFTDNGGLVCAALRHQLHLLANAVRVGC